MTGTERIMTLAVASVDAAAKIHAETERLRWEAWKADRRKGKEAWKPIVDRSSIVATFQDIFGAAVEEVRRECARGE